MNLPTLFPFPKRMGLLLLWLGLLSNCSAQITWKDGPIKSLNPDLIGLNGNLVGLDHPWNHDSLVVAVQTLGPGNVRYPGGTIGNYWDWDRGWLDASVPDSSMIKWVVANGITESPNRYPLENFAKGIRETGAAPVFMVNMLSQDLAHTMRNLRKADSLGLEIAYVELGNELYFNLPFESRVYPTPEDYGKTCAVWIDSIKSVFPQAQCGILGNYLRRKPRHTDWTPRALAHCPKADAVIFHKYSPFGLNGQREKESVTAGTEGQADAHTATRQAPKDPVARQQWELDQLQDPAAWANMLSTVDRSVATYRMMDAPDSLPIWCTEFNVRADHSAIRGTWAQALFTARYYDQFLHGPFELLCIHNITGTLFPQIYTDTEGLSHIRHQPVSSTAWTLSASGAATHLFARAIRGCTQAAPMEFSKQIWLQDDRGQKVQALMGWHFSGGTSDRRLLINAGYNAVKIETSGHDLAGSSYRQYQASLGTYLSGMAEIEGESSPISQVLTLPPHSITLIQSSTP
ncbi:hypothetical protein [Pontibacter sp. G13]|uniref:hypothetical protein n=1 Tax=Pontibacter sp. G13 TaxID=3074898 RepID=UPI00288BDE2B|nr:hypothetical protein [Pontibacter sp. G13]WNJ17702.1 hypothetical protein RJD25_22855 [Pontibacter sp. G13]